MLPDTFCGGILGSAVLGAAVGSIVLGRGTLAGFTVGLVGGIASSYASEAIADAL